MNAKSKEYRDYIHSPQWRANRKAFLKRSNGICERCKKYKATEVHHLNYDRLGKERLTDCEAVCDGCHPKADQERAGRTEAKRQENRYYNGLEARYGSEAWRAADYDSWRRFVDWDLYH